MPLVRRSTPMFSHPPINYVRRPTRRAFLAAALAGPAAARFIVLPGGRMQRGLGDCIPGQPSTDPNCFTTPAYIRALNLKQDTSEQASGLLPAGNDAACYDQYMTQGGNFNPDAYNRCIGAQDVTSAAFNARAAAGVPFASNVYVAPVDRTPPPPPPPAPAPKPAAQSNAPGPVVVGGGAGQSNAPPTDNTVKPFSIWDNPVQTFFTGNSFGIPNWWLTVGGGGLVLWGLSAMGGRSR